MNAEKMHYRTKSDHWAVTTACRPLEYLQLAHECYCQVWGTMRTIKIKENQDKSQKLGISVT